MSVKIENEIFDGAVLGIISALAVIIGLALPLVSGLLYWPLLLLLLPIGAFFLTQNNPILKAAYQEYFISILCVYLAAWIIATVMSILATIITVFIGVSMVLVKGLISWFLSTACIIAFAVLVCGGKNELMRLLKTHIL